MIALALAILVAGLHGATWAWVLFLIMAAPELFLEVID